MSLQGGLPEDRALTASDKAALVRRLVQMLVLVSIMALTLFLAASWPPDLLLVQVLGSLMLDGGGSGR